jgi:superfamily II DNA or RNA helicase
MINNKGNWEFNFFQKIHDDKNMSNLNKEANIKIGLRMDNGFNPKHVNKYINQELSKEEVIINKINNKEILKTNEKIIIDNYYTKQKHLIENDKELIKKFSLGAKPETIEGKLRLMLHTLEYQINNNNYNFVANIFLRLHEDQFKMSDAIKKEFNSILIKMNTIVAKLDLIDLQFNKFHTQMPPLNQKGFTKLDDWQIKVIDNIDNNISTIISAPTSAGKSVISGYVITKGKSLFIVPTDALAWQLASYIGNILNTNVPILTDTYQTYPRRDEMINILNNSLSIVGTADVILDYLPFINNDFKWVIYDEIHMIGQNEGKAMDYIIRCLNNIPMLALSATIGNISELSERFTNIIHNKMDTIICNKRFFNLQRYYYNGRNLDIIHPLSLISEEDFINGNILIKTLEPTPPDVWSLIVEMKKYFKLGKLDPYVFFNKNERIVLDKVNTYFKLLIKFMYKSYNEHKDYINNIIAHFNKNYEEKPFRYSDLLFKLKQEHKLPAIVFQQDTNDCLKLAKEFAFEIEGLEYKTYPKLLTERLKLMKQFKRTEKKLDKDKLDSDMDKKSQKQMMNTMKSEEVIEVSLQEPCDDFIFNTVQPFTNTLVEEWVNDLKQYFPIVNDTYHYIIMLLWRGVGIYAQGLPDPYLRLVQSLATQKKLAVVFSDKSLVFGISMPFRSVVISKYNNIINDSALYHQMAGRAGRRGLDKEGNIIFAGYSWTTIKELSIAPLPNVLSITDILYTIPHVELLSTKYNWTNILKKYNEDELQIYNDIKSNYNGEWAFALINDMNFLHFMWRLRYNKDCINIAYLLPYLRRYFDARNYNLENNQIDIAMFLCRFICIHETTDKDFILEIDTSYQYIIDEMNNLQLDISNNVDKQLFLSIQHNVLFNNNPILRERLMYFGTIIRHLQHYCYHSKIVSLCKLLGKLLTRIWWIYHTSSPILQTDLSL